MYSYIQCTNTITCVHTQRATDRVQNVGDATAGPGDPGHDPSHGTACLHYPQLAVKQQVEGEHAAESGGAHLGLCTQFTLDYYLAERFLTYYSSRLHYNKSQDSPKAKQRVSCFGLHS
jgi:hypothetical protein